MCTDPDPLNKFRVVFSYENFIRTLVVAIIDRFSSNPLQTFLLFAIAWTKESINDPAPKLWYLNPLKEYFRE